MPNKLTQHELRKIAVQFLYSITVRPEQEEEKLLDYILDGRDFITEENKKYLKLLIDGIRENQQKLEEDIAKYLLKTWSLERLTLIDKIILELSGFEILYTDLPDIIAVNEAVNLTKDFSDEAASKLVNGILTNLIKKDEN
ncbi:MAG: transcription antitermination factor NusB [Streptococcaceae bacterium]|jgi:transcription antitermination factor NusB|nr:transcription antitermination factor NusB [Streptococcaceae bacterium]